MGTSVEDLKRKLPARFHAQIDAARAQTGKPLPYAGPPGAPATGRQKRVRQSTDGMNKLEREYYDMLKVEYRGRRVMAQQIRLENANGDWYKPDIFIPSLHYIFEVKGPHAYRGGFEKLKVAANAHLWLTFFLVWKVKGQWLRQEILPSNAPE